MENDKRLEQLTTWIHQEWPNATIEVASADASFRRYFRISNDGESTIAMDAPPEKEDCIPFIDITERLLKAKVHAPKIIRQDLDQGFLLLEDLGNTPYLDELLSTTSNTGKADQLYGDALQALINIQQANTKDLPEYDADFLMLEMGYMQEWFLQMHLNIHPNYDQQKIIDRCLNTIVMKLVKQPQVFVHRDYHSRNLMVIADEKLLDKQDGNLSNNPGVIDYQDAMLGPITYDLVSLLRDCYIQWPNEQVEVWALDFKQLLEKSGILSDVSDQKFIEWFDYMGLQRHIKVLGIFARLNHRDGKSNYLNDLPLTLEYMMQVAKKYPDTKPLYELFIEWDILQRVTGK